MTDTLFPNDKPVKKKRARKRDDVWEAMMAVFWEPGFKPCDKNEEKHIGRLVKMARERLPKSVHKTAAISILRDRVRLYKQHQSFRDLSASADAVMNRWFDVNEKPEKALHRLCEEWLKTVRSDAAVLSSSFDPLNRLAVYLLVQEKTGELTAKRPDLEGAAACRLTEFRHRYSHPSRRDQGESIKAAVKELA